VPGPAPEAPDGIVGVALHAALISIRQCSTAFGSGPRHAKRYPAQRGSPFKDSAGRRSCRQRRIGGRDVLVEPLVHPVLSAVQFE
jgi:hypothetical protein